MRDSLVLQYFYIHFHVNRSRQIQFKLYLHTQGNNSKLIQVYLESSPKNMQRNIRHSCTLSPTMHLILMQGAMVSSATVVLEDLSARQYHDLCSSVSVSNK